jgi:VCBS repeat-containing protein
MDFERDWNGTDRAEEALHPHADALAAKGKSVQPGRMHHANSHATVVKTVAPDAQGVVVLPAGTDINQIEVSGRNLIVHLPDGTEMVILDGAVVMPRLVVGDVEIPAVNLAALLIGEEPQPAAGPARSSGGNFIGPDGDVGDPHGLGDLLPPTELQFTQSEEREILPFPLANDERPEVTIITPDQPAGAIAATAGVSEAGLPARGSEPAGSAAATDSEKTSGTISIIANDGLAGVTINGTAITTVGQTVTTPLGVLTITSLSGSAIGYSYVLTDNVVGTPPAEIFTIVVTDADGDQATATLTITVADDAPTAINDVDSVTEDGPLLADGNVLTGVGGGDANTTDGVADVQGADGAVVSTTGAFQGTYGTLTLDASGAYSYALANGNAAVQFLTPGQTLTDSFSYTIRDADGDTSTATLTITINGADDGISITGLNGAPGVEGAEVVVQENDLSDGSSPNAAALTQTGSFGVSGADGLSTVTVGGVTVLSNGAFVAGQVVTTPLGTLTITGFTATSSQSGVPTAGTFTYSFLLTDNSLAHQTAGADSIFQNFAVAVTDRNGSTASGSIDVQIVDDVPMAVVDSGAVNEGGTLTVAAANGVLANDQAGADGFGPGVVGVAKGNDTGVAVSGNVGVEIVGNYGTLTLFADGSYRYEATPNAISADRQDVFVYTIRDGDGDLSTATLTINVADVALPADNQTQTVYEAALDSSITGDDIAAGSAIGSTPDATTETVKGQLNVTGATGYTLIGSSTTAHGQIQLNSDGSYTYTLTAPFSTTPAANDGAQTVPDAEVFTYQAVDGSGNVATGTITINVVDDVPTAVNDAARSVAEDGDAIGGNVLANDVAGADGATLTSVTIGGVATAIAAVGATSVTTAYGVYSFTAAGAWIFNPSTHLNNAIGVDAGFAYTITDGDGDQSSAIQPITVTDGEGPTAGASISLLLDDQNLAAGASPANPDFDSRSISFTPGSDAIVSILFGNTSGLSAGLNWERLSDTQITGSDANGVVVTLDLSVVGNVATVTATLNNAYTTHPGVDVDDLVALGSVQVIARDADGDNAAATVSIGVSDDLPVVSANAVVQLDDDALTGGNPGGTGDDANSLNATGTLSHDYRADGPGGIALLGTGAPAGFTYESDGTVLLVKQGGVTVLTVTLTDAVAGTYSVVQNAAITHPAGEDENDVSFDIAYRVTDADNDSAIGTLTISVDDDTPLAADDTDMVKEDVTLVASGNVLTGSDSDGNPAGADSLGADGPAVGGAVTAVSGGAVGGNAAGAYGTLVLNASGGYSYTLNNTLAAVQHLGEGQTLTDSFTYTITDRDGDSSTATLTITVQGTDDAPQVGSGVAVLSEEGLSGANADTVGSPSDTTNSATASGTIDATDPDGNAVSMTLGDPGAVLTSQGVAVTWTGVGTQLLTGSAGGVPVITITITDGGAYTVTLLQSIDHSGIDVEDLKIFTVPVTVSDGTSSVGTNISVTIEDDSPLAVDDMITTREKAPASTGNVLTNDHVGADAPGAVLSVNGNAIAAGGSQTIVGLYGTLQIFSDGSYSYTPKVSVASGLSDSFTYTMRDADNDTASATLKFTFAGDANRPTADNVASKVDDDGLPGGNPLSTLGDVNTNVGDLSGLNSSEASYSGKLSFGYGPDGAGSLSFANLNGVTATVGTETVIYSWNAGTSTLLATVNAGARAGTTLFQVALDTSTGAYTVTLLHNVLHAAGGNEADAPQVDLAFVVTDSDYDAITNPGSSATGALRIVFNDDMPSAFTPTSGSVVNNDSAPAQFALNFAAVAGADGVGGALFTVTDGALAKDTSGATLRLNGEELYLYGAGTTLLTARTASGAVGYTVTLLPGTDRYEVDLHGTITNGSEISISSFSGAQAGNVDFRGLGAGTTDAIDILMSGRAAGGGQASVNTRSTSIGIGNQSVDPGEALRIDFVKNLATAPAQPTGFNYGGHQGVISFEQLIAQTTGGGSGQRSIRITAIDADDDQVFGSSSTTPEAGETFVSIVKVVVTDASTGLQYGFTANGTQGAFTVAFAAGHVTISGLEVNDKYAVSTATPFDAVLVESPTGNGSLDLGLFSLVTANVATPITISHPIIASDGDGDSVTSTVGVTLTPASAPPVAIDLDDDGLEFVGLGAGVTHDYGQGEVATAWVSRDDGLLAHAVGGGYDIVFADDAPGAKSDLDGLRLAYDSNGDGMFDAKDTAFAAFGVWQDANANGRVDAGEYKTLAEAGIAAINLTADGKSYTAANGDVTVLGEGSFVRTDGSKGTIGDVQFATGAKTADAVKADSATGFNQALVAASLVAMVGVAEAAAEQPMAPVATESTAPAAESSPAPTSTAEPTAMQDSVPASSALADDHPTHDQPVAQVSHGDEEAAPGHAVLSGSDAHDAPAETAQAEPDVSDHQGLLAQSIALPPSFDGNAAAVLAAQQAAPAVTAADVVREALGGHDAPHIDALLAALPGGDHPTVPALLSPTAVDAVADSGHLAAMAAIFEAAQAAHEAMAVAHG